MGAKGCFTMPDLGWTSFSEFKECFERRQSVKQSHGYGICKRSHLPTLLINVLLLLGYLVSTRNETKDVAVSQPRY